MFERLTLTVEEAGKRLGISRPMAYELTKRPDFPVLRIGRRIVIPIDGLDLWIRANTGNRALKQEIGS